MEASIGMLCIFNDDIVAYVLMRKFTSIHLTHASMITIYLMVSVFLANTLISVSNEGSGLFEFSIRIF